MSHRLVKDVGRGNDKDRPQLSRGWPAALPHPHDVMRRVFAREEWAGRGLVRLARMCGVKLVSAYKWCEEFGDFGSGRPSALLRVCKQIDLALELAEEHGESEADALYLAEYPSLYFRARREQRALVAPLNRIRASFRGMREAAEALEALSVEGCPYEVLDKELADVQLWVEETREQARAAHAEGREAAARRRK